MKIIKKVVDIGNGAAVYVPKEYSGRDVVVLLPEGVEEITYRVLNGLIAFMPNILGVYLYGSYARKEQQADSDIDVLVITKEKDERISLVFKDIDLRVVPLEGVRKAIKNFPLLITPILQESKVLLNPLLLEELKNSTIDIRKFKWHFEDIHRIVNIIEGLLALDDKDISPSYIYSLMMRIRSCYLMECLLEGKKFSNVSVKRLLFDYGFEQKEIEKFFTLYRLVREDRETTIKIGKEEISRLIHVLKDYSRKLENETEKKIKNPNHSRAVGIFKPQTGKLISQQSCRDLHPVRALKKGIESLEEQVKIHKEKLMKAMEEADEDLVRYYEKDILRLEQEEKKKKGQLDKS